MNITRRSLLRSAGASLVAVPSLVSAQSKPLVRYAGAAPVVRADHALMFLGIPLGYYESLGYRAEYLPTQGSAAAIQLVLSGAAEVANCALIELINMKSRSKAGLPIRIYYSQEGQSAYRVVVRPESPINSLQDLKGKTIGVPSLASGTVPFTRGLLRRAGLGAKDVELMPVGLGPQAIAALKGGRIDALSIFIGAIADMENRGEQFREFTAPIAGGGMAMSDSFVQKNPDLAAAIFRGTILNEWVMFNEREVAVRAYWKQFGQPNGDPTKLQSEHAHLIKRLCDTLQPWGSARPRGIMTEPEWTNFNDFYSGDDGLFPAGLKFGDYFDPSLVSEGNKVDLKLAEHAAKALK